MEGALLVSVGLPDITNNVVIDAVENVVKIIAGVGRLFGDDEPKHLPEAPPYPGTVAGVPPYPGMPPATPPPPPPGGGGGLDTGATGAGDQYNGSVEAAQLTDEKLAEMLKQIFAANQGARDKVSAILTEIQNKQKQIGPEMGDPASVAAFGQFLDQKFAEIQKVLTDAQVDAKTQAAILDALGDEYRNNGPDAARRRRQRRRQRIRWGWRCVRWRWRHVGGRWRRCGGRRRSARGSGRRAGAADGPAGRDGAWVARWAWTRSRRWVRRWPGWLPQAMGGGLGGAPLDALGPALSSLGALGGLANGGFTDKPPADAKARGRVHRRTLSTASPTKMLPTRPATKPAIRLPMRDRPPTPRRRRAIRRPPRPGRPPLNRRPRLPPRPRRAGMRPATSACPMARWSPLLTRGPPR